MPFILCRDAQQHYFFFLHSCTVSDYSRTAVFGIARWRCDKPFILLLPARFHVRFSSGVPFQFFLFSIYFSLKRKTWCNGIVVGNFGAISTININFALAAAAKVCFAVVVVVFIRFIRIWNNSQFNSEFVCLLDIFFNVIYTAHRILPRDKSDKQ